MKIAGRSRLHDFCVKHPDARTWIEHWLSEVEAARWTSPHSVRARFPSASFLADNIVIFNVKGNHYRLEVRVAYRTSLVIVVWIGTHAAYDQRNGRRQ